MTPSKQERVLYENEAFTLTSHKLSQGTDEAILIHEELLQINRASKQVAGVTEERFISIPPVPAGMPNYRGDIPVLGAMYKLAIQELQSVMNDAGLLTAGANWDGVWTRDIAYAIILGAAIAQPEACRRSLDSRIKGGLISQDTGTGGGWPISTDRVVWILAAWVYVRTTNDMDWLRDRIDIMQRTLEQDERVLNLEKGIVPGETSFLDWREQNYPDWMSPADIGASYAFGTNLLHVASRRALSAMLSMLDRKDEAARVKEDSCLLRQKIEEKFWNRGMRQYGMMITPDGALDDRPDALATGFGALFGLLSDHAQEALNHLPRSPFGTAAFGPCKISQADSYHNRSVWPFTEAFVLLAHAELQDMRGMEFSMASLLRASMLFGSNKENFHALTGEASDTVLNSDAQLWSSAGMLGMFYIGLFGIRFEGRNLVFTPCVPKSYAGSHWLMGLRLGGMTLDIHINGYGTEICSALVNGSMATPIISLDSSGHLIVELELQPSEEELPVSVSYPSLMEDLAEPQWDSPNGKELHWLPVEGATVYRVFSDGKAIAQTAALSHIIPEGKCCAHYRIQALNERTQSCLNEPFYATESCGDIHCLVQRVGAHGEYPVEGGQAWLHPNDCTAELYFTPVELAAGSYDIRIIYSNGAYSRRDGDGCALRALYLDEEECGFVALPQQGEQDEWDHFAPTSAYRVVIPATEEHAEASTRQFSLRFTPDCDKPTTRNECLVRELVIRPIA